MKLEKATIIHYIDNEIIFSFHRSIYIEKFGKIDRILKLPFVFPRDMHFGIRLLERLTRSDKCHVTKFNDNSLLIIRAGSVYRWNKALIKLGEINGDCPLHTSSALADSGNIYFGEYFMNPNRDVVNIYKVNESSKKLEIVYSFTPGLIRHVHTVVKDPFFKNRIWVTVGDENEECFLFWTDDEFNTLHKIGDGSQLWRAVGLIFTETHLCWGTDSPLYDNHFVRMNRKDNAIQIGQPVPGTIWYAGTTVDGLHYASCSVEKGSAIKGKNALVYVSYDTLDWKVVASFRKDNWPMPLFKWGTISFPAGKFNVKDFWISGEALKNLDGCSKKIIF